MRDSSQRVFVLLDPATQDITNQTSEAATARLATGDPAAVGQIEGSFALVGQSGILVHMARTMDRPLRFFLAKRADGPMLVVADRIDRIAQFLREQGLGDQFHPSYTRMVPAHHVLTVELRGCPDPSPVPRRFFTPERGTLPADLDLCGQRYVEALYAQIKQWLAAQDRTAPLGVAFSGGVDSGSVLLLAHHALHELAMNPARLKAFTLAVDGGAGDLAQAREFLSRVGLELYLEAIEVSSKDLDASRAVGIIEDYKPLDVQCATAGLALLAGIRSRYPDWRLLLDGDGGDENFKDYTIAENPELTIKSVLSNPLLYHEGWGVSALKHSQVYSGGLSRGYVRTYAPARHFGFIGFSPCTRRPVVAASEAIPFVTLTDWSVERLYALKGEIVSRGVRRLTGIDMPVFPKCRFQRGAMGQDAFQTAFRSTEAEYRRAYLAAYA